LPWGDPLKNKQPMGHRMLLEKLDLFKLMFLVYLAGIAFYDRIPLLIPLRYPILRPAMLGLMCVALAGYLAGEWAREAMGCRSAAARSLQPEARRRHFALGVAAYAILLVFGATLFVQRGAPLLAADAGSASAIKSALNRGAFGRTRAIDVWLPFISLYCLGLVRKHPARQRTRAIAWGMCLASLGLLFLRAFKGNILLFLLGVVFVLEASAERRGRVLSIRTALLGVGGFLAMAAAYYVTEGANWLDSMLYIVDRLFVYSWEGLHYIVYADLPGDLHRQLQTFVGLGGPHASPDVLLARRFTGNPDIQYAVAPTLMGFLYRNGGLAAVGVGLAVLGLAVRGIYMSWRHNREDMLKMLASFYLYVMLLRMLVVGNVFHEIRGYGLSVLLIYAYFRVLGNVKWPTGRALRRRLPWRRAGREKP